MNLKNEILLVMWPEGVFLSQLVQTIDILIKLILYNDRDSSEGMGSRPTSCSTESFTIHLKCLLQQELYLCVEGV